MFSSSSSSALSAYPPLYLRRNSAERGRYVVAARPLSKHQLVLVDRPLVALVSRENLPDNPPSTFCHNCWAFIGGPVHALRARFGDQSCIPVNRKDDNDNEDESNNEDDNNDSNHDNNDYNENTDDYNDNNDNDDDNDEASSFRIIPCPKNCGHVFCSVECRDEAWHAHHAPLCTGRCETLEHPLVEFKRFTLQSNEIFLLVAQWWSAQESLRKQQGQKNNPTAWDRDMLDQYTDFVMPPWWEVVTLSEQYLPDTSQNSSPPDVERKEKLAQTLRKLCEDAAEHLSAALTAMEENASATVTAWDIAVRVGACEQNAVGLKQRHPLCRDVLENQLGVREKCHDELVKALTEFGDHLDEDESGDDDDDDKESEEEGEGEEDNDDASGRGGTKDEQEVDTNNPSAFDEVDEDQMKQRKIDVSSDNQTKSTEERDEDDSEKDEFTMEEVARYLSKLFVDEFGTVVDVSSEATTNAPAEAAERDATKDDLDEVFPCLDGTGMYHKICKMNHSCEPNILVLYNPRPGWGRDFPLAAYAVAVKDIEEGEELTISYVETTDKFEARQQALANYGFKCICPKCKRESNANNPPESDGGQSTSDPLDPFGPDDDDDIPDDPFGPDDDDDPFGPDNDNKQEASPSAINGSDGQETGTKVLENIVNRLDTVSNNTLAGVVPRTIHARVSAFVLNTAHKIKSQLDDLEGRLLRSCCNGLAERDFALCRLIGTELEKILYSTLLRDKAWKSLEHREAYWIAALTVAMGHAHEWRFLLAQRFLDKAIILGLPRKLEDATFSPVASFLDYVERHATELARGPYGPPPMDPIPNILDIQSFSLSITQRRAEARLVHEENSIPICNEFHDSHVATSTPLVVRGMVQNTEDTWRNITLLAYMHGHRLIPVELGSFMTTGEDTAEENSNEREQVMSLRQLICDYLAPSNKKGLWSLEDAVSCSDQVAYLAQHPLLSQISTLGPELWKLSASTPGAQPPVVGLCGPNGPSKINVWLGTGGTRTRLHFDSYDNWLVQLAGYKYVRLYDRTATPNLYVSQSKTGVEKQGNISALDCEREDFSIHPMAQQVPYQEVILCPGDALFVPSHHWHYVRSLSTSLSVNYWF